MAADDAAKVVSLARRMQAPRALEGEGGIALTTAVRELVETMDWSNSAEASEDIAELFNELAAQCPPILAHSLLVTLETAIVRFRSAIPNDDDSLTSLHLALAAHCHRHRAFESPQHLLAFNCESDQLPVYAHEGEYFWHCSEVYKRSNNWDNAALHAALALAAVPDTSRYRHWILCELIAYGKVYELPRKIIYGVSCPLIQEFARYFDRMDRTDWPRVMSFQTEHGAELQNLKVLDLVRRATTAYFLKWLRLALQQVSVASLSSLLTGINVSIDELEQAGLTSFSVVTRLEDGNVLITPLPDRKDPARAQKLLHQTATLASKLK